MRGLLLFLLLLLIAAMLMLTPLFVDDEEPTTPDLTTDDVGEKEEREAPSLATTPGSEAASKRPTAKRTHSRARDAVRSAHKPARVAFTGVVRDAAGKPLRGVDVIAVGMNGSKSFRVNDDGTFSRELVAGRYDLLLQGDGLAQAVQGVLVDGALTEQVFTLVETGTLSITVLRGGEPMPSVDLTATRESMCALPDHSAVTGADGIARLELPPGRYKVMGGGWALGDIDFQILKVDVVAGDEQARTIRIRDTVRFSGTVRGGKDKAPVADALVTLGVRPAGSAGEVFVELRTGSDGTFDREVPRGRPVRFRVEAAGYAPFPSNAGDAHHDLLVGLESLAGEKPVRLDVLLTSGATLVGEIRNAQGRRMPNVDVALKPLEAPDRWVTASTNAKGRFTIAHVPPGHYRVHVTTPGLYSVSKGATEVSIGAANGEQKYALVVWEARQVAGRVVTPGGEGVGGARVWALDELDGFLMDRATGEGTETWTRADGSFVLTDLPTNEQVTLRVSMGLQAAAPVVLPPQGEDGPPQPLKLVLGPAGHIEGLVVDLDTGRPVPGAVIELEPVEPTDGRPGRRLRTGGDGSFQVTDLLPGTWRLTPLKVFGYHEYEARSVKVDRASVKVRFELDPGVVFAGVAVTDDGSPAVGAFVSVQIVENGIGRQGRRGVTTDDQGRFLIPRLDRGKAYVVRASLKGFENLAIKGLSGSLRDMRLTLRRSP